MPPALGLTQVSDLLSQLETMQKLKSIVALPGKNLIKDYDSRAVETPKGRGVSLDAVPITIPCYMLSHPWHKSCTKATWDVLVTDIINSLKVYSALYTASGTLRFKSWSYWKSQIWKDIVRSTLMLTANRVFLFGGNCIGRNLLGKTTPKSLKFIGFVGSFLAILIERVSRRNLLAFFMGSNAVECFFNRMVEKGTLKSVKHIEVMMFMLGSAILGAFLKSRKDALSGILHPLETIVGVTETGPRSPDADSSFNSKETGKGDFFLLKLQKFRLFNKLHFSFNQVFSQGLANHQGVCPHQFSCPQYIVQGTLRGFSTGFVASFTISLIRNIASIVRPWKFITRVFNAYNLRVAAFTALFVSTFRACCCLLRRLIGDRNAVAGAMAGFIGGLSFMVLKSYIIALYVLLKASEVMIKFLIKDTCIDRIPFKTELIYSLAVTETAFGLVVHPQNVRADYRKFVNNITNGKITAFNRQIASAHWNYDFAEVPLYPEFDPKLAERCVEWIREAKEISKK